MICRILLLFFFCSGCRQFFHQFVRFVNFVASVKSLKRPAIILNFYCWRLSRWYFFNVVTTYLYFVSKSCSTQVFVRYKFLRTEHFKFLALYELLYSVVPSAITRLKTEAKSRVLSVVSAFRGSSVIRRSIESSIPRLQVKQTWKFWRRQRLRKPACLRYCFRVQKQFRL